MKIVLASASERRQELLSRLVEEFEVIISNFDENKVLSAIAYGEGIPGRAERILNDEKLNLLRNCIIDLLTDIDSRSNNIVLNYEKRLDSFKDSKEEVLKIIEDKY